MWRYVIAICEYSCMFHRIGKENKLTYDQLTLFSDINNRCENGNLDSKIHSIGWMQSN